MSDWIPYGKPWIDADCDDNQFYDSWFVADGLNKPGTLIEIRETNDVDDPHAPVSTRQLLIGHINANSGKCGCCGDIKYGAIVTRYRVVWDPPTDPTP